MALLSGRTARAAGPPLLACLVCLAAAATATAGETLSAAQLELEQAARSAPYLRLDLTARTIEVRLRGRTVETIELDSAQLLRAGGLDDPPPPLELPAVWLVASRPPSNRALNAPATLLAEEEDTGPAAGEEPRLPPDVYSFATRGGPRVDVGRPRRPPGAFALWRAAVADGWARLRGRNEPLPDRLELGLAAEDARRLHHLFRPGVALILVAPAAPDGSG